ncbi:MAG: hypothetical protein CMM46_03805 [Rhodospirillaceae bacterium]|nr:hypothetical protein [Rhodospirillaceae bacterium]|tara:strand:+ start:3474 stop:4340 length:867 start_codon:yes stop_codon:yes gene_type:complete
MNVTGLGYLVLETQRIAEWRGFGSEVLGMEVIEGENGCLHLRMDDHVWRLKVESGKTERVAAIGWEAATPDGLKAAAIVVENRGLDVSYHDGDELSASRGVAGMITFSDPGGQPVEIFHGRERGPLPTRCGHGHGFVTGDLGMGHVFVVAQRYTETCELYEALGFRLSDRFAGGDVHFYRCGPREHAIAIGNADAKLGLDVGFDHLMVEVDDMDGVGLARDACRAGKAPIAYELGRHTNDRMFSFYAQSPSDFAVELGWGGLQVDEASWEVTDMTAESVWGHQRPLES